MTSSPANNTEAKPSNAPLEPPEQNPDADKKLNSLERFANWRPYESLGARLMENTKTVLQFSIGIALTMTLLAKGFVEIGQTWEFVPSDSFMSAFCDRNPCFLERLGYHLLHLKTFAYIAAALAVSAGLDLGYMLFTDGPDEALQPLLLCLSSAAFYTISNHPEGSWVVGIYVICIFALLFSLKKYKEWSAEGKI
ncbi:MULTISPECIES: hypothetical protein [Paraburkholderia]|uniref:hypothetical protein n=1 Tax=Paraburkholderia TaxID=1822464 RepID=UPI0038B746E0